MKRRYRVSLNDVWGNETDGFYVNDVERYKEIEADISKMSKDKMIEIFASEFCDMNSSYAQNFDFEFSDDSFFCIWSEIGEPVISVTRVEFTIQQLAEQLFRKLKNDTRDNGDTFYFLVDDSPAWMRDVIREVHGSKFPDDTVYQMINRVAGHIADCDYEAISDIEDSLLEIEVDIYTHDLTKWLHTRLDHIHYIDEVIENGYPFNSGFDLLQQAQQAQIHEVGHSLIYALVKVQPTV